MFVCVLPACKSVPHACLLAKWSEESVRSPGNIDCSKPLPRCWKLNLGLEEQPVPLSTEPCLQPLAHVCSFLVLCVLGSQTSITVVVRRYWNRLQHGGALACVLPVT